MRIIFSVHLIKICAWRGLVHFYYIVIIGNPLATCYLVQRGANKLFLSREPKAATTPNSIKIYNKTIHF